jgi:hypothetical protein
MLTCHTVSSLVEAQYLSAGSGGHHDCPQSVGLRPSLLGEQM